MKTIIEQVFLVLAMPLLAAGFGAAAGTALAKVLNRPSAYDREISDREQMESLAAWRDRNGTET